jgi:hypothetical protein
MFIKGRAWNSAPFILFVAYAYGVDSLARRQPVGLKPMTGMPLVATGTISYESSQLTYFIPTILIFTAVSIVEYYFKKNWHIK